MLVFLKMANKTYFDTYLNRKNDVSNNYTVVIVNNAERVCMSVTEELACNDIRIGLNQGKIFAVEAILEPVQRLSSIMPLVTYFSTKRKRKKSYKITKINYRDDERNLEGRHVDLIMYNNYGSLLIE